jgi:uroporphyrinogen decarboxylase
LPLPALQADSGAQSVQIFDSWASHLSPQDFDVFAGPYIKQIISSVKQTHPDLPIILYISGSGGLLERMAACSPDIISIDQSVDLVDGIKRVGSKFAIQVGSVEGSTYAGMGKVTLCRTQGHFAELRLC